MYDASKIPKLPFGQGSISIYNEELLVYKKTITLPNGSKSRKSVYGKTPKECMERMSQLEKEVQSQPYVPESKEVLVDKMTEWLETVKKPTLKSQSYRRLESTIRVLIGGSDLAHYRYQSVTPEEIQRFINSLVPKYSKSSIKKVYDCFNAFYKYYSVRYKFDNPMVLVEMPRIENEVSQEDSDGEVMFFTDSDIAKFIKESKATWKTGNPKYQGSLMYAANIYLGMRMGELLALQWKDIDLDNKVIFVHKTLIEEANPYYNKEDINSKKIRFRVQEETKTNRNRYVPINSKAEELILLHRENCVFLEKDDFVISTRNRRTSTIKNAADTIKKICTNAGTDLVTGSTHVLRHTAASLYFRKGVAVEIVAKILGHSPEVCRKIYIHLIQDQLQEAAKLLEIINI